MRTQVVCRLWPITSGLIGRMRKEPGDGAAKTKTWKRVDARLSPLIMLLLNAHQLFLCTYVGCLLLCIIEMLCTTFSPVVTISRRSSSLKSARA